MSKRIVYDWMAAITSASAFVAGIVVLGIVLASDMPIPLKLLCCLMGAGLLLDGVVMAAQVREKKESWE